MRGFGMGLPLAIAGRSSGINAPSGSSLWTRADRQGLGAVSSWTDLSGNGNNPSQATGTKQPVNTAGVGPATGLPALVFTSANSQVLTLATPLIGTVGYTIALVGQVTSTAASQTFINVGDTASGLAISVDLNATSRRDFNANGVVAISDNTSLASTAWEAWIFTSDSSGNLALIVNGVTHTLSSASATLAAPSNHFVIGELATGASALNGNLFEVLVYTSQSTSLTNAIKAYQSAVTKLF